MISITHKIELKPNNKQKTYFRKAFGCARLAYNWGLAEWKRQYKEGGKPSGRSLRKQFTAIKRDLFPFVDEVSVWAVERPFHNLDDAFQRFFKKKAKFPTFKKKRAYKGNLYINGQDLNMPFCNKNSKRFKKMPHNLNTKHQYIKVPRLGCVKMCEKLRFDGEIKHVNISQSGDKFYAAFCMEISNEEFYRTHKRALNTKRGYVGIDLGLKSDIVISEGLSIHQPRPLKDTRRKHTRLRRKVSKRIHAKTKQRSSKIFTTSNGRKCQLRCSRLDNKIANIRKDYINKVTSILASYYSAFGIEDLHVQNLIKNRAISRTEQDVSWFEIRRQLEQKTKMLGTHVVVANQFFASSKTCSRCGSIYKDLTLLDRTYECKCCGLSIDRDLNAAINLREVAKKELIGRGTPESTPVDLTALLADFDLNGIVTSKVETGMRQTS